MVQIIDGKALAQALKKEVKREVETLQSKHAITPGLAVIRVGNDPASEVYVRSKRKQAKEVGMHSWEHHLLQSASQDTVLQKIHELNANPAVHGILVQLPVPKHLDEHSIINTVSADKDVDGLHVVNAGRLLSDVSGLLPCTPLGCLFLLRSLKVNIAGKHALVIGRSRLVGKPMAHLLLAENCTATVAHSKTENMPELVRQADIIIAAAGKPNLVKADWVKDGAIIIDVGINRLEDASLVGDVDFEAVKGKASAITPVPGGVGPMTVACLLYNTVMAACRQRHVQPAILPIDPVRGCWCPA